MAFFPGRLFGVVRSYDRAGFCPRKFFPHVLQNSCMYCILFSCTFRAQLIKTDDGTMLRGVCVLNTGCLPFVLIIVF